MINELKNIIDENIIKTDVNMSEYSTFRTGGTAKLMVLPTTLEQLKTVVKFFNEYGTDFYVLGNGSNLLISDEGVSKPIICMGKNYASVDVFENCITAKAGAFLSTIAKKALENSLTGFEFAAGIPGTLGGALIMNAGAYGREMKDVIEAVSFIDVSGNEHIATGEEMEFSYRNSVLADTECIITGATLKLSLGNPSDIEEKMSELALKRREKQPLEFPSAGSTFKRPYGYYAGSLIESSNLKGVSYGGAQVSEKHAGFIINKGNATTTDICELIRIVKETVYEKHGVLLEEEVKYWD